jgi:hypothetical protein
MALLIVAIIALSPSRASRPLLSQAFHGPSEAACGVEEGCRAAFAERGEVRGFAFETSSCPGSMTSRLYIDGAVAKVGALRPWNSRIGRERLANALDIVIREERQIIERRRFYSVTRFRIKPHVGQSRFSV